MQAIIIRTFGEPAAVRVEEIPTPAAAPGEILVQVRAAAINPSDVKNVTGAMHGTTLPRVPGRDFAGIVVAGPAEMIGREVFGTGGEIGFTRDGSHAQYVTLPREGVAEKPAGLTFEAAGSAGVTFVTAWSALVTAAEVTAEDVVVVIGAGGGVGSAAVQIARTRGARVIGVVRSDKDAAYVRELGAHDAINSKTADVVEAVRSLTGGKGGTVLFDTSGMMFAETVEAAALEARIPVITAPKEGTATFNLRNLYRKTLRVIGVDTRRLDAIACAGLLRTMGPDFQAARLTVQPAEAFPLDRAAEAYTRAAHGGTRVVLLPSSAPA